MRVEIKQLARGLEKTHGAGGGLSAIEGDVNIDLLRRLSQEFPLRLIGPTAATLDGFGERTRLLGSVPQERLPELLADVDVIVLPYKRKGHTRGVIPAKTFECLATGKPTVAVGLPSLSEYGDLFHLCNTDAEFLEAVRRAPADPPTLRQRRVQVARQNSWDRRIDEIEEALRTALNEKETPRQGPASPPHEARKARDGLQTEDDRWIDPS